MKLRNKGLRTLLATAMIGLACVGLASCGQEKTVTPEIEGYNLLWADEFESKKLDESIWNRELRPAGWTNSELQEYVASEKNGFIRKGKFVIKGIENKDGTYTSTKITTRGKADFKYGKVVVSAKVPEGKGLWPAIWMMPQDESVYGQWPKCGEIDIMEVLGHEVNKAYCTVHYGEPHAEEPGTTTSGLHNFAETFHEYSVEWEPAQIRWYVDGYLVLAVNDWFSGEDGEDDKPWPAPFNQLFSIQINLAIGGTWPGNPEPGASYMKNAEFEIDYVRVYQKPSYDENVKKPEKYFRPANEDGNYINNGDFATVESLTDSRDWHFLENEGGVGSAEIKDGKVIIKTTTTGTEDYSIQFLHHLMPFIKGKKYKIEFDIWSDEARTINEICIDAPNAGWQRYWAIKDLAIGTEQKHYEYEFTMAKKSDNSARFEFNMGKNKSTANVYITNVRISEVE